MDFSNGQRGGWGEAMVRLVSCGEGTARLDLGDKAG